MPFEWAGDSRGTGPALSSILGQGIESSRSGVQRRDRQIPQKDTKCRGCDVMKPSECFTRRRLLSNNPFPKFCPQVVILSGKANELSKVVNDSYKVKFPPLSYIYSNYFTIII